TRRLENRAVAGRQRRSDLPCRHQQRKVERNDLSYDAQRLLKVVGVSLVLDLGYPAFLGGYRRGEVPEMIGRQRDVGRERLAHRLSVLVTLRYGEHLGVLIDRIGNGIQ